MKNAKKKNSVIPALSLALCLAMSVPLSACAAESTASNPENINAVTNYASASYTGTANKQAAAAKFETKDGVLIFPEGITAIDQRAFANQEGIVSVVIPDTVTSIGDEAFSQCKNLTSITIPDSVKTMGKNVFLDCKNLTVHCAAGSQAATYAKTCLNPENICFLEDCWEGCWDHHDTSSSYTPTAPVAPATPTPAPAPAPTIPTPTTTTTTTAPAVPSTSYIPQQSYGYGHHGSHHSGHSHCH